MSYDVRVPEALILAPLQPWVKLVWIAARSYQGSGDCCFASLESIGQRAVLGSGKPMDKGQVSHGLRTLEAAGFIGRIGPRKVRCIAPESSEGTASNVEPHSTNVEPHSTFTPKSEDSNVEPHSTNVEPHSTPSENQKGKPKRKTKRGETPVFLDTDWQMVFGVTAFERLDQLGILPGTLARQREHTLQAFAGEFDKLHRIDGYDQETITEVMRWLLHAGNWWIETANFRSVLKLRKPHKDGGTYFEHFLSQARTKPTHGSKRNHTRYTEDDAARIYELALAGAESAAG